MHMIQALSCVSTAVERCTVSGKHSFRFILFSSLVGKRLSLIQKYLGNAVYKFCPM